jgi:hypothetical protein
MAPKFTHRNQDTKELRLEDRLHFCAQCAFMVPTTEIIYVHKTNRLVSRMDNASVYFELETEIINTFR